MTTRVTSIAGQPRYGLATHWEFCPTPAGAYDDPEALARASLSWLPAGAPSTAAADLRAAGAWSLDAPPRRFDAEDWWYRARFARPQADTPGPVILGCDGLATVADLWLNGTALLHSENMFLAHELDVTSALREQNELLIRFRALDTLLEKKRPRPKWRTPMVEHQQLRWWRTTLLGRTPGWSPPAAPVGPWRPVWLETRSRLSVTELTLRTGVDGTTGWVEIRCGLLTPGSRIEQVELVLCRGGRTHAAVLDSSADGRFFAGRLLIDQVERWWPHTHGEPALYDAQLRLRLSSEESLSAQLRRVGFRTVQLERASGDFAVRINETAVFCRGACWTPIDPVSLSASADAVRGAVQQFAAAGLNMLRVGGTMVYESDAFLDECDAQGILLWQDFMFANMSYPEEDADFVASVSAEVRQQLDRLAGRPCLTILCGNSEGEQQAAMWGVPRDGWEQPLFSRVIGDLAASACPEVPYWPSSAHGGAFPHQGDAGTTSYYGVGAYLRPLEDARRSQVRFASECLAFANVPHPATLEKMPGGLSLRVHHPGWKARTPRDLGAGWDFDDVRDHYLKRLYGIDPLELRYGDHERYLTLSRIISGEVMAATFAEWRRKRSTCRGALLWFWRDLWSGAGWGVIDAVGRPKAAYHYVSRVSQPIAVFMSDEGGNGLFVHLVNDGPEPLESHLELRLYRSGDLLVSNASRTLTLQARSSVELCAMELFGSFTDLTYAYRFGPPTHELIVATLSAATTGAVLCEAHHFDRARTAATARELGLSASATARGDGEFDVVVRSRHFAQSVWFEAEGFEAQDEYFHVSPGAQKTVRLKPSGPGAARGLRGRVFALNGLAPAKIELQQ